MKTKRQSEFKSNKSQYVPDETIKAFIIVQNGVNVLLQYHAKLAKSKVPFVFKLRPDITVSQQEDEYKDQYMNRYIVKNNKAYKIKSLKKGKKSLNKRRIPTTIIPEDLSHDGMVVLTETIASSPSTTTALTPISQGSRSHTPLQFTTSPLSSLRTQSIFPPQTVPSNPFLYLDKKDSILKYLIDESDSKPRVWPDGELNFVDGLASVKKESGEEDYTFDVRLVEQNNMIIGEAISPEVHRQRIDHSKILLEYIPPEKDVRRYTRS